MGKATKRHKSYYINIAKKRKKNSEATNILGANIRGFLCTSNGYKEKDCLKESYNLLNEFADKLSPLIKEKADIEFEGQSDNDMHRKEHADESGSDSNSEDDIESALKNEIQALQTTQTKEKTKKRFQQMSVDVKNCIFISTTLENPVQLSLAIMDNILESQKVRTQYLVRMVPVQVTCKAYPENIEKAAKELVHKHFPLKSISFYVAIKVRNNDSVKREIISKSISSMITDYNLEAVADFRTPDVVLNIDVLKTVCCLGLLPQYMTKYCKYNLLKLGQQSQEDGQQVINNCIDKTKECSEVGTATKPPGSELDTATELKCSEVDGATELNCSDLDTATELKCSKLDTATEVENQCIDNISMGTCINVTQQNASDRIESRSDLPAI